MHADWRIGDARRCWCCTSVRVNPNKTHKVFGDSIVLLLSLWPIMSIRISVALLLLGGIRDTSDKVRFTTASVFGGNAW